MIVITGRKENVRKARAMILEIEKEMVQFAVEEEREGVSEGGSE